MTGLKLKHSIPKAQQCEEVWQCVECNDHQNVTVPMSETLKEYDLVTKRCATCRADTRHTLFEVRIIIKTFDMSEAQKRELQAKLDAIHRSTDKPAIADVPLNELMKYELWRCETCGTDVYYQRHGHDPYPTARDHRGCQTCATRSGAAATWHVRIRTDGFGYAFNHGMKSGVRMVKTWCRARFTHVNEVSGTTEQRTCSLEYEHKGPCA